MPSPMRFALPLPPLAMTVAAGCTRLSPEMQVVADAAEAMGGADRIQAVRSLTMEGAGRDLAVGGSVTPEAPPNVNLVTGFQRTLDAAAPRMRTAQTRTAQYRFANAVVVRQDQGLDGDVAYNVPAAAQPVRSAGGAAAGGRERRPRSPGRVAAPPAGRSSAPRSIPPRRSPTCAPRTISRTWMSTLPSGETVTLARRSRHQAAVARDRRAPTTPTGATSSSRRSSRITRTVGGLQLPATIVTKQDQWTTTERTLAKQTRRRRHGQTWRHPRP